jgi:hypothetical protein
LVNAVTFIIIKMLANYIGEGMATTIIDSLSSYLSGAPPQPGQVLFGGPSQSETITSTSGVPAGGAPLPQMNSPFGNIDVPSLLSNLGSMFIRGQTPTTNSNNVTNSAIPTHPVTAPQVPMTPRYLPAYNE